MNYPIDPHTSPAPVVSSGGRRLSAGRQPAVKFSTDNTIDRSRRLTPVRAIDRRSRAVSSNATAVVDRARFRARETRDRRARRRRGAARDPSRGRGRGTMTTLRRAREREETRRRRRSMVMRSPRDGGAREVDRERWVARARERLRDGAGGTRAGRRRRPGADARALGGVVVGAWAVRGVGVGTARRCRRKGGAKRFRLGERCYYKANVASSSRRNADAGIDDEQWERDLYVSRTSQPSTGHEHRSMNTGNALDSVTI